MNIQVDKEGSIHGFQLAIDKALAEPEIESLIILSCDANGFEAASIEPILKKVPVPVCGGIFPAVISGKEKLERGSIVIALKCKATIATIPNISSKNSDHVDLIDQQFQEDDQGQTMFVFIDGLAERIDSFISSLFTVFGLAPNYIGGGAGSLTMQQKPCLLTNQGLVQDAAILALFDLDSGIGVSHGWTKVRGPFRVTESRGNAVISINWEPAFEVYQKIVGEHSGTAINEDNFFEIARAFPFGIAKLDNETVVRDPIALDAKKSVVCCGGMPEGAVCDILTGDQNSLIEAAGNARQMGESDFSGKAVENFRFFVDCISRVLFLNNRFEEELAAVATSDTPLVGVCSIGEIANCGKDFLEFYNKTAVVAILESR